MAALVYLLFITMISIDFKISFNLFVYFFGINYNVGEPTSATSKERMATNIILAGATSIK